MCLKNVLLAVFKVIVTFTEDKYTAVGLSKSYEAMLALDNLPAVRSIQLYKLVIIQNIKVY